MDSEYIDRPIQSEEDDLLGFKEVAELLAQSIASTSNDSSITIGLEGQWGSGKTSILLLLQETMVRRDYDRPVGGIGIVNVSFSPWLITNRSALIISFFAQLSKALDIASSRVPKKGYFRKKAIVKSLDLARRKLNQFSGVVATAASVVSAFDPSFLAAGTAVLSKAAKEYTADQDLSIEKLKSDLTALLSEIASVDPSFRLLVTIDDLDRLEPTETNEVIRLVKAVADFPATFYLLSYDRDVVADAIQKSVKIPDGYAYLEKIIQFSFKVPPLQPFQLCVWFRSELAHRYKDKIDFSSHRSQVVIDRWGGRLLTTPRDVRRLLFSLQLIWPKLENKVDLLDLIWLQMIKEKASSKDCDLYSWTAGYLQSLDAIAIGGNVIGRKQKQDELEELLRNIGWRVYEHNKSATFDFDMHHLDQLLIGVTSSYLGKANQNDDLWIYQFLDDDFNKAREHKRLSSPNHWRIYFSLDLPSHALTDPEWHSLIDASQDSQNSLSNQIQALFDEANRDRPNIGDQLIERALYSIRSKIIQNPIVWLLSIAELSESFEAHSNSDRFPGFGSRYEFTSRTLANVVISETKGTERKELLTAVFDDFGLTCFVSRIIRDQISYQNKDEYERKNPPISHIKRNKLVEKSTSKKVLEAHSRHSTEFA